MIIRITLCLSLIWWCTQIAAQGPGKSSSGDIYEDLQKLNFLGSALYVAAHPDDENTSLISLLSNGMHVHTAYLSLTRGDGGQNRIGTEIGPKLGLIRTNELLAARQIDGGHQFFSRAVDFGYSKNPEETLNIWHEDDIKYDMVKVLREFRPDIVINRFDHRTPGSTHGHHTSSAILSLEAVDLAADTSAYRSQLDALETWNVKRVFFNSGWWFYGSRANFESADKSNLLAVDVGEYFPVSGRSNSEISALSRSQHKSQGFGATGTRGSRMEYLELIRGSLSSNQAGLFEGINTTWSRVEGGAPIGEKISNLLNNFNFIDPSVHLPVLLDVYQDILNLNDDHWRHVKIKEVEKLIVDVCGLFLEARIDDPTAVPGQSVDVVFEATNRSTVPMTLTGITLSGAVDTTLVMTTPLPANEEQLISLNTAIRTTAPYSNPYWLNETGSLGIYAVSDPGMIGQPLSPPAITADFILQIGSARLSVHRDLVYKTNDPVQGEVYAPFNIVPDMSVAFTDPVYIFSDRSEKEVIVEIKSFKEGIEGSLRLDRPGSWIVQPNEYRISLPKKGTTARYPFVVKGPLLSSSAEFGVVFTDTLGNDFTKEIVEISYDHIPAQKIISTASAKFERIGLKKEGNKIAYIEGAGDDVPKSLRQIGYEVDLFEVDDINFQKLKEYDAVVIGIRAYNVKPELKLKKDHLLQYIYDGGTVLTQYNTNRSVNADDLGPFTINLSRERVTDENAAMSMELPDHEVLNYPNKITTRDFENWVQERGLYFANEWDFRYVTPLSSSDPGEPLRSGGLIIGQFGKGYFIYTGFSWFRQLPAGVPGAYRLFANLLSIGKNTIPTEDGEESNN